MGFFDNPVEEVGEAVGDVVEEVTGGDQEEEGQSSQPPASFPGGTDTDGDGSPDASIPETNPKSGLDTGTDTGFTGGTDTDDDGQPDASVPDTEAGSSTPASFPKNDNDGGGGTSVGGATTPSGPELVTPEGETVENLSGTSTSEGTKVITGENQIVENPRTGVEQAQTVNQRIREKQAALNRQSTVPQPKQEKKNQRFTPFQPETQPFRQDAKNDQTDFGFFPGGTGEESLETGTAIAQAGQQAGKTLEQGLKNLRDTTLSDLGFTEQRIEEITGQEIEQELLEKILNSDINEVAPVQQPTSSVTEGFTLAEEAIQTVTGAEEPREAAEDVIQITTGQGGENEQDTQAALAGSLPQELAELPSLPLLAAGSASELREQNKTAAAAATRGAAQQFKQAKQNPSKTFTDEVGGELLAVGAPGTVLLPETSVTIPEPVQTAGRFVEGDLGTRATDTRAEINLEETDVLRRGFETQEDKRIQFVEGRKFTEKGTELSTGQGVRIEEPLTRTQFLKEKAGLDEASIAERIQDFDLTQSRKGQAGIPKSKRKPERPNTEDATEDFTPEDVFIEETTTKPDLEVDIPTGIPVIDSESVDVDQGIETVDLLDEEQRPQEKQPPIEEQPPETIEETVQQLGRKQNTKTGRPEPEIIPEETVEQVFRDPPAVQSERGTGQDPVESIFGFSDPGAKEEVSAAPSVDAILFGETTEDNVDDETVFTGFETREVSEEFNLF